MPTDRWLRLEQLFAAASEQPASGRADFLARACGPDEGLREEVASMLDAAAGAAGFLEAPALDVLARQVSREGWSVQPGDRIASYSVERRLGAGGMGEVWRARDERLGRDVAIKLLLPQASSDGRRLPTLEHEARAAGALNHPNVLTVYDVGDHRGATYLVTECLEGESLRARLVAGALPVEAALEVALQVARGLGAAHARGIVHRDLKPENIFLTRDGRVKILDFGLATGHGSGPAPGPSTAADATRSIVAGTAGYMAPEQVRGEAVDGRADVFALGAVLHEMLAGSRAFKAESTLGTLDAVLRLDPPDLTLLNPQVSPALSHVVRRCLARSPDERFATVAAVESALESIVRPPSLPSPPSLLAFFRRPAVMVFVSLAILVVAAAAWRSRVASSRVLWARTVAAPEIQRLSNQGDYVEAFLLARRALDVLPDDPHLAQLWRDASSRAVVSSDPAGADVAFAAYRKPRAWVPLGRTPLGDARNPRGLIRIRISKPGYQTIEASASLPPTLFRLDPVEAVPPGMVRVMGGRDPVRFGAIGALDDYWIDRFEVTNRRFKDFVDHGGYRRREYWQEPFRERGRPVGFDEAMARFRDATGRPGPATWTSGSYPAGRADFPVAGVSWYEAAAYAAFAGKSLPTMYHWFRAANLGRFADILAVSNFDGKGPAAVGSYEGLGPFGTYDMAGNVKEWCWNESGDRRYLLGGAWNEPRYMFADYDAKDPFDRAATHGFRLVKYMRPPPTDVTAPVPMETFGRDARKHAPVGDAIFAVFRRQHAYDRLPLEAVTEATEETETGQEQIVAFDAANGGERMRAHLFLPRNSAPPYQVVIFFPATDAFQLRSSRDISLARAEFIVRSGRALLYPVYKGTYERAASGEAGLQDEIGLRIAWSRDLGRAIDYLETRPDIDRHRVALYGVSAGADAGLILSALEPRLKTSVLQGTGIDLGVHVPPEIDTINYAPRVRIPTLLLNGRYDFELPFETAQRPLFDLLGSPAADKRHVVFETGHALPVADVAGAIVPWLDRYLGPVLPASPPAARGR